NNLEIHKDLAEKEIFNFYRSWFNQHYPQKEFKDLLVHHIDKDKFNYDLSNLIIISPEQHKHLHANIQHKNWNSGIKALQSFNIKSPHILELGGESEDNPYAILGLNPGAPKDDIKRAYKELCQKNHPDKVNHLDKQFILLAERRMKKIIWAYEQLKKDF
ncbi:J domain-containing protein, partial [Candidatus Woesearchaeota archaeon]|nr:J domain-containing protein [Candidatus Woesearchaeota archaeon]